MSVYYAFELHVPCSYMAHEPICHIGWTHPVIIVYAVNDPCRSQVTYHIQTYSLKNFFGTSDEYDFTR